MTSVGEQAERIEILRGLLERLCDPELTLAEAKVVRGRLFDLLDRDERLEEPAAPAAAPLPVVLPYAHSTRRQHEFLSYKTSALAIG